MALNIHIWIRGTDQGEIRGDSTVTSMNREGTIEAFDLEHMVQVPTEASGRATGSRSHAPVKISKRIDRSSPLLQQVLSNHEELEVTIKFYRPNPSGDGTTEHFYTMRLRSAHVSSIKTILPNTLNESTASAPAMEVVSFVFGEINYVYEPDGVEFVDEWRAQA